GADGYASAMGVLTGGFGKLVAFVASYAFFYHLCNGIRHLFWDAGKGFEISQFYASGYAVIAASILLTLAFWGLILAGGGS
ncbi:MAG: succinate dehydrogenase, cytochrome b556 subunit, partial [Gammaproteobacteria bacterium]